MAVIGLGKIVVAAPGTLVPFSQTTLNGSWLTITPNPANVGPVYLGTKGFNRATGAGLIAVIQKTANPLQIFTNGIGIRPEELFLDADNAGDFVWAGMAA